MSGLPLQPIGQPWPPQLRRWLFVLTLVIAVLALGWVAPGRPQPAAPILGGAGHELEYAREAQRLIDSAQRRIWIMMYVIRPDDGPVGALLQALMAAQARGVEVRVGLDLGAERDGVADLKHEPTVAWFQQHGIAVVLDEKTTTTHGKVLVVDSRYVLSGSHNWTRSALVANRELSWLVDDRASAARIEEWMRGIPGW